MPSSIPDLAVRENVFTDVFVGGSCNGMRSVTEPELQITMCIPKHESLIPSYRNECPGAGIAYQSPQPEAYRWTSICMNDPKKRLFFRVPDKMSDLEAIEILLNEHIKKEVTL